VEVAGGAPRVAVEGFRPREEPPIDPRPARALGPPRRERHVLRPQARPHGRARAAAKSPALALQAVLPAHRVEPDPVARRHKAPWLDSDQGPAEDRRTSLPVQPLVS